MRTAIGLALSLLIACGGGPADDDVHVDASASVDAARLTCPNPPWLELVGIRLCDGKGLCPGGDVHLCRQEVESLTPAGNFCPGDL